LIARLYSVEDRAKGLAGEERLALRKRLSVPLMAKLHAYLLAIRDDVLPYPSHEHHWRDVWGDDIVGAWRRSKVSAKNIGEL
jgi:hypothetical protein